MQIFLLVTFLHFLEHILQVFQLWVLHWPRPQCMGGLGLIYPWMMKTEWLHYGHALFMLLGLAYFRSFIIGKARPLWDTAFVIQFWHHLEHFLLLTQALVGDNFGDFAAPVSIAQIVVQQLLHQPLIGQPLLPRIELHFFYNAIVLAPMLGALYLYRFPIRPKAL